MIVMLDTSEKQFDLAAEELGYPIEQLLTPLTRFSNRNPKARFAIDNGAFTNFNRKGFESLLEREWERKHHCRFVAVPDVVVVNKQGVAVGDARRTLEVFDYWFPLLCGWPLAFVCQDGQENFPIPWEHIAAVFIGGSTRFKESDSVKMIIKAAKAMDKWAHVGRVNCVSRFKAFEEFGADSVDGSGIAQYSHMRHGLRHDPPLFKRQELMANI